MKRLTTKEFITKATNIHDGEYSYENAKYINNRIKITITCKKHGNFEQTPDGHFRGQGCPKCMPNKIGNAKRSNTEEFIKKANKVHGEKYSYNKVVYIGNYKKVIIVCQEHGEFEQTPHNHLVGKGCQKCGGTTNMDKESFIIKANKIHNGKYSYENVVYTNNRIKITITCHKHGGFKQSPSNHLAGNGCPKCLNTYKQNKWLDSLGIPDDPLHREVTIHIGEKRFKADGYDPETKTVYEFNGDSWHGNPKLYKPTDINPKNKITYGALYDNTILKEKILIEAGYTIKSIWESDWNKLQNQS
jgi:Zn finger protein HypA/HybF involved in hydrogenase expression